VGVQEQAASPEADTNVVPGNTEDVLEVEDSSVEVRLTIESGEIDTQVDLPRHRNPRCGKQLDMTKA
jgi:hypothetical protein